MTRRKKILMARIGAFGDVCMLAPMVRTLARSHEVHWLIRDAYVPVVRSFPEVDCRLIGVAPSDDPLQPFPESVVDSLVRERYDVFVDCSHWACVAWLARRLADVPIRAVTHDPLQDRLLAVDRGVDAESGFNCIVPVAREAHQIGKWRVLFRAACGVDLEPEWTLPERPAVPANRPLRVFLHPHAGKPEKIWPTARFASVLADAARRRPVQCVVNGVRRRIVRELRLRLAFSRVRLAVAPFDPTFVVLREELARCDLALGCDSGPMHFASLLGVPTVVLYGRYSAAEFGPPWRSTAVEPAAGLDVDAVRVADVSAVLEAVVARAGGAGWLGEKAA